MLGLTTTARFLRTQPPAYLQRPLTQLQPVLATAQGTPNIDLAALAGIVDGLATLAPQIAIESPAHWESVIRSLGDEVDGILPISISAYPTEIWNSHPQPLIDRGLPVIFWPIIAYDEPDFWRWSARDFLTALGVPVHLVRSGRHGVALLRALAMKRLLAQSRLVVFGEQNFPWNATAGGHLVTESLGLQIVVRPLADIRTRAAAVSDADVTEAWEARKGRFVDRGVRPEELAGAVRSYLAIKAILEEEQALGFGVNCFGDLITGGGRDVPCLAQMLLREDGYIASCDGDYLAMTSMVLTSLTLDKPCMMSNMYPVQYVGALTDHFGDPLSPDPARYPREEWQNFARLAHCGFVGVVSPEMTPTGTVALHDWGGTYEIKRDGRGCGIDGALAAEAVTIVELKFDGRTLVLAAAEVAETTRHAGMRHCEATALLKFRDLPTFIERISREHTVVVYGDQLVELQVLAEVLGLQCLVC
jgi:hypothetical protein